MKNVVIIDFSLDGHHLSFMQTFCSILIKSNCKVFAIVPEAKKLLPFILEKNGEKSENFIPIEDAKEFLPTNKKNSEILIAFTQLRRWQHDAKNISKIEKEYDCKVDFVFFAWIDYHLGRFLHPMLLNIIFPYKWSGLYFHPYHLRHEPKVLLRKACWKDFDSVFLSKNCLGVAIHDLGIKNNFEKRIGKPVLHFPETANDDSPDLNYELYKKIKEKAGNRLIVGIIGCEPHKGTLTLVRAAREANVSDFYFAFLGILPQNLFSAQDWHEVNSYIKSEPENAFFHFEPIPEGAKYNAVFSAFDIIYLVYNNFISSSNRLTKAAIFQKLVVAQNNFCVGDDVKNYKLGEAIPPGNPQELLNALQSLKSQIKTEHFPFEQWKAYAELNSIPVLEKRFQKLLSLI